MGNTTSRSTDYVLLWATAVDRQRSRALDDGQPSTYRLVDATLFANALRNLLRAVRYACKHATKEQSKRQVGAALAEFDKRVPKARLVRDALEHFDEYDQGKGFAQGGKPRNRKCPKCGALFEKARKAGAQEATPWPFKIQWENSDTGVLAVGPGISLTIADAWRAAMDLHQAFELAHCADPKPRTTPGRRR